MAEGDSESFKTRVVELQEEFSGKASGFPGLVDHIAKVYLGEALTSKEQVIILEANLEVVRYINENDIVPQPIDTEVEPKYNKLEVNYKPGFMVETTTTGDVAQKAIQMEHELLSRGIPEEEVHRAAIEYFSQR